MIFKCSYCGGIQHLQGDTKHKGSLVCQFCFRSYNIVNAIIADLSDRRGFRQAWDDTDKDIQEEIRLAWINIVKNNL